jgi:hypothetical protein
MISRAGNWVVGIGKLNGHNMPVDVVLFYCYSNVAVHTATDYSTARLGSLSNLTVFTFTRFYCIH